MYIAVAVHGALSRNAWASNAYLCTHIQVAHACTRESYVNAMCSLAAELIVKAGALGIGAQGGDKTTTAAPGTTRYARNMRSRGATKCVYACVVGARYIVNIL